MTRYLLIGMLLLGSAWSQDVGGYHTPPRTGTLTITGPKTYPYDDWHYLVVYRNEGNERKSLYTLDSDEPIVVPAVHERIVYPEGTPFKWNMPACFGNSVTTSSNAPLAPCYFERYHCADGDRVPLTSDNGKLHVCLKLPEVTTNQP